MVSRPSLSGKVSAGVHTGLLRGIVSLSISVCMRDSALAVVPAGVVVRCALPGHRRHLQPRRHGSTVGRLPTGNKVAHIESCFHHQSGLFSYEL